MPALAANIVDLAMLASRMPAETESRPIEYNVNRDVLLDIAPDREAIIKRAKDTDELRELLAIRVALGSG